MRRRSAAVISPVERSCTREEEPRSVSHALAFNNGVSEAIRVAKHQVDKTGLTISRVVPRVLGMADLPSVCRGCLAHDVLDRDLKRKAGLVCKAEQFRDLWPCCRAS